MTNNLYFYNSTYDNTFRKERDHTSSIYEGKNYGSNQSYSFMQMTHNIILLAEVFI